MTDFPIFDLSRFEQAGACRSRDARRRGRRNLPHDRLPGDQRPFGAASETMSRHGMPPAPSSILPPEEKSKARAPYAGYPYGYLGPGVEALAKSKGADTPPDLKESFNGGPLVGAARAGRSGSACLLLRRDDLAAGAGRLRRAWKAYYAAMEDLAARIMRVFAVALKLPEDHFAGVIDRPVSALRALNYPHPTVPPQPGQLRAGAHTDYGSLTILLPEAKSGGLADLHAGAGMAAGAAGARRLHHQYRRPDGAVDQRPLGVDAAPRRQPGARRQGLDAAAILRLLPPAELGCRDQPASNPAWRPARRRATRRCCPARI